jgi:RES domain-containing protein
MKITAWRITREKYLDEAFTGEGSKLWGGRWNPVGSPAVYCAEHLSLAILELIVHLEGEDDINTFVALPVSFSSKLVQSIPKSELPKGWNNLPIEPASITVGKRWLDEKKFPVLEVPSTIVPIESNFVINPLHPVFSSFEVGQRQEIQIDSRIENFIERKNQTMPPVPRFMGAVRLRFNLGHT